jgi:hypothetical protein
MTSALSDSLFELSTAFTEPAINSRDGSIYLVVKPANSFSIRFTHIEYNFIIFVRSNALPEVLFDLIPELASPFGVHPAIIWDEFGFRLDNPMFG